jgi:hypothetical protein
MSGGRRPPFSARKISQLGQRMCLSNSSKQQVAKEEERRAKAEDGRHFDVDKAHARSVDGENHGRGHQHTCEAVALSHPILRPAPPDCQHTCEAVALSHPILRPAPPDCQEAFTDDCVTGRY